MSETKVIRYTLELKQPVLATDVQGDPNSAVSSPYVTGALLRGAVAGLYLNQSGRKTFETIDPIARALFLSETTRFLNAYPVNEFGKRALPTPIAWRHDKKDGYTEDDEYRTVYDLSRSRPEISDQGIGATFCWLDGGEALFYTPPRQVNVHTQRDASKGRATEDDGAVYRYDALAAGLRLQAAILTTSNYASKLIELLSNQTLWLGRARRAGYGKTSVIGEPHPLDYWRESGTDDDPPALGVGEQLRVTFTSDVLLRDCHGQATLDPCHALAQALNIPAKSLARLSRYCWAESKIVGGFNRKWGLPLPQTVAIAAGSVFCYEIKEPIEAEKLQELERNGLGERRNEGFGRLLINWQEVDERFESRQIELPIIRKPEMLSEKERGLAEILVQRMLRQQLDSELRKRVNYTKLQNPPNNHQLSRVRGLVREVQAGRQTVENLTQFFDELRESARKQFERARIIDNGKSITWRKWLDEQLDQAQQKWRKSIQLGKGVVTVPSEVGAEFAQEYALRLIEQVIYRAAKDQTEEEND